jgi:hypothetical protein
MMKEFRSQEPKVRSQNEFGKVLFCLLISVSCIPSSFVFFDLFFAIFMVNSRSLWNYSSARCLYSDVRQSSQQIA